MTAAGFSSKHILITGASSGLGQALAEYYAAQGTESGSVILFLSGRHAGRLGTVAKTCRDHGAEVVTGAIDVTDRQALRHWIEEIDQKYPLDLVIANAGISGGMSGVTDGGNPAAQDQMIFDVNVTGVVNTVDVVLPRMVARGRGQIALMSSLASFAAMPGAPAYAASKGAVRMYGEALSAALAPTGVHVSVICPGFIKTPMTDINNFHMPFLMQAPKAAKIIARGIAKNRMRIAFPLPLYVAVGFIGLLPARVAGFFLSYLPKKPDRCP